MTPQDMKQQNTSLTTNELNKLIIADRQRRVETTQAGIQAVLNTQNCQLQARPQIVDGLIVAMIQIVPNLEETS
jgi:hypothetical protein